MSIIYSSCCASDTFISFQNIFFAPEENHVLISTNSPLVYQQPSAAVSLLFGLHGFTFLGTLILCDAKYLISSLNLFSSLEPYYFSLFLVWLHPVFYLGIHL